MLCCFRKVLFRKKLFRPLHIKLKELREENTYISSTENGCSPSLHGLAKYLQENHKPDHHILRDRAFCHDALLYWWNKEYDTMELFCTDGYWGSIFDVWFHQKLYLRCVVNECEGFLQKMEYSHPELVKQESGLIIGTPGAGRGFHTIDIPLTAADERP